MEHEEIKNWKKQRLDELANNPKLQNKQELLRPFLTVLNRLQVFVHVYNKCKNKVNQERVLDTLNVIEGFATPISLNALNGDTQPAYYLKFYCLTMFDECSNNIEYINEFKTQFAEARNKLDQSIGEGEVNLLANRPMPPLKEESKQPKQLKKKTIEEFIINVNEKNAFLEELKTTFKTERGIKFRILIELLKDEKVLLIGERQFKQFFICISNYFGGSIGSYQSINDLYKHSDEDKNLRSSEIDEISQKLNPLILKFKCK